MSKFEHDLSRGNVALQLIRFSLPLLLSNLIQTLYNVADMMIVGRFAGTASMSGVNIGGQVTFLVTNLVIGFCVGGTVLIGQYKGAGDKQALKETTATLFTALLIIAAALTGTMMALNAPLLRLIQTPAESFDEAYNYFMITAAGTVFIIGYNALAAVMRGLGDSRNPLIFVGIACFVNIGLDLLMVGALDWKAAGAALATVISQAVSMILCVLYLKKGNFLFDFKPRSFRITKSRLKLMFKVGLPTAIQNVITSASFLVMTAMVNSLGVIASAAVGVVGKLNGFAILPAAAMSASVSAVCAQNIGAGEEKRAQKTLFIGIGIALGISAVIFAVLRLWPEPFLQMFDDDPDMIVMAIEYMKSFSYDYLIVPMVFCLNGLFIGAGHTNISLINNAVSALVMRVPMAYLFGIVLKMELYGMGLGAPFASLLSMVIGLVYFLSGAWKKRVVVDKKVAQA